MEQQEAAEVETAETTEQVDPRDEQIANLQAQLAEVQQRERDAVLRSKAEVDNMRRRTEQDVEKAHKFALEKFVNADTNVPLDPNVHQAIAMVESEDVAPGNVLMVMQKGYTLNGRTIRAAMVSVAKAKA